MGLVTEVDSGLHQFAHRELRIAGRGGSGTGCFGCCCASLCEVCGGGASGFG